MEKYDLQIKRLESFPVLLVLIFNVIIFLVVAAILYFFFDMYILSFNENIKDLTSKQLLYFITEGYERILVSFALWSFVLISVNVGCAMLIMKMQRALLSKKN